MKGKNGHWNERSYCKFLWCETGGVQLGSAIGFAPNTTPLTYGPPSAAVCGGVKAKMKNEDDIKTGST